MTTSPTESSVADEVAELRESVERLSQVVEVLTSAVDELADLLQWHINNVRRDQLPDPIVVSSLPVDPSSNDWRVNRASDCSASHTPGTSNRPTPGKLFD